MKNTLLMLFVFAGLLGSGPSSYAARVDEATLQDLAKRFKFFLVLPADEKNPERFLYADSREHVHIYSMKNSKPSLEWEITNLGSRASAVFVKDIDHNGTLDIVIATAAGRILVYNASDYSLEWENLQDRFEKIECMTAANIDLDPQDELIFIANGFLYVYDGKSKTIEWQSQRKFSGKEIILGNVDDDEQLEIIINTGFIIDSRFYNVEFESDTPFGDRISLLDINNDGFPEVIGETPDFTIRVYDIYAQRELW